MLDSTQHHTLLMLSGETTVPHYLLLEDDVFVELLKLGNTYEELLSYINDNF
jgi:hypothetical protein